MSTGYAMASAAKIAPTPTPGAAPLKTPKLLVEWQSGPRPSLRTFALSCSDKNR